LAIKKEKDLLYTAVAVGDNCIDNYHYPIKRTFVGGSAVNVAIALHRCGITTSYVGAVASDKNGKIITSMLKAEEINISMIQILPGTTAVTDVKIVDGDRVFLQENFGVLNEFYLDNKMIEFILKHKLVHNTYSGQTGKYLPIFREAGAIISFDYSNMQDKALLAQTLPFVDIAFVSATYRDIRIVKKQIKELANNGPQIVVATMGSMGSLVFKDNHFWFQPAIPIADIVDTLGAGDSFIGTFLSGWLRKKTMEVILKEAVINANKTCQHYGAWISCRDNFDFLPGVNSWMNVNSPEGR